MQVGQFAARVDEPRDFVPAFLPVARGELDAAQVGRVHGPSGGAAEDRRLCPGARLVEPHRRRQLRRARDQFGDSRDGVA